MKWLILVQVIAVIAIVIDCIDSIFKKAYQSKSNLSGHHILPLTNTNAWKLKILPFVILIATQILSQITPKSLIMVCFLLAIIILILPIRIYLIPFEDFLIKRYRPVIVPQKDKLTASKAKNNWPSVQIVNPFSLTLQFGKHYPHYIGFIIIPDLALLIPFADYTSNEVYQFGAGMLVPQSFRSNAHMAIGAHNLGYGSHALFSPLASNQLYLSGVKVIIATTDLVKEFQIDSVQIISSYDVETAISGPPMTVSLVTCTEGNSQRFLVNASLIKQYPFNDADASIKCKFDHVRKER